MNNRSVGYVNSNTPQTISSGTYYWSANGYESYYYGDITLYADAVSVGGSGFSLGYQISRYGFSLRCVKNTSDDDSNITCKDGFTLTDGVCLPPTTGSIEHCLAYRAPGECVRCAEGYIPRRDFAFCQLKSSVNGACTATDKVGTMQTFKQTDCDNYATPSALNFTLIGCLEDERDGKLYEVRKFADGKCWMVIGRAHV